VQLLSRPLHRQIFGSKRLFARPTRESVDISRKHLAKHGLAGQANTEVPDIHFDLPPLQGDNLTEHFHNIAHEDCAADLVLADDYAKAVLPRFPEHWQRTSGWTCYEPDGSFHSVDHPPADVALTFDVETMYTHSPFAVLAIAATDKAWYGWVSPWLLGETEDKEQLIPMPARSIGATRRIVVGHAVSYDRARILDEYHLESSGNRFIDTMSLHIARRGLSSPQRPDFLRRKKFKEEQAKRAKAEGEEADEVEGEVGATVGEMTPRQLANTLSDLDNPDRPWYDVVTTNGLADVVNLHFNTKLSKEPRDLFGPGATRDGVLAEFHELMNYCATDVLYTHQVYRASFPDFRAACPAPASIAGILHMASALLPVDADWPRFIAAADAKFNEYQHNIEAALVELAEKERLRIHESPDADGKRSYDDDPWLRQLDWSAVKMPRNLVRPALAPAGGPAATADARPPRWTRALAPNDPSSGILLRLTCEGRPLRWRATTGWIAVSEDGTETLLLVDGAPLRRIFDQRGTLTLQRTPSVRALASCYSGVGYSRCADRAGGPRPATRFERGRRTPRRAQGAIARP
jgi:DNA polymerase gamma 1